jgi:hypothetical protein
MILRRPGGRLLAVWTLTGILILLAVPVGLRTSAAITGLAFLVEFLTEGQHPWLSRMTEAPVVEALPGPDGEDLRPDLWRPGGRHRVPWPGLVLVHGLTPEGKRDGRLAWTAARLARAGFAVAVPDLPALRAQRLRPEDALIVRETLVRLAAHPAVQPGPVVMLTVSVGLAPAALALAEPGQAERVRLLVALGGHADARELIRYFTTGAYGFGPAAGRVGVEPSLSTAFLARNLDLVPDARDRTAVADALRGQPLSPDAGPGARAVLALLQNRDPARVDALLDNLPAETRALRRPVARASRPVGVAAPHPRPRQERPGDSVHRERAARRGNRGPGPRCGRGADRSRGGGEADVAPAGRPAEALERLLRAAGRLSATRLGGAEAELGELHQQCVPVHPQETRSDRLVAAGAIESPQDE